MAIDRVVILCIATRCHAGVVFYLITFLAGLHLANIINTIPAIPISYSFRTCVPFLTTIVEIAFFTVAIGRVVILCIAARCHAGVVFYLITFLAGLHLANIISTIPAMPISYSFRTCVPFLTTIVEIAFFTMTIDRVVVLCIATRCHAGVVFYLIALNTRRSLTYPVITSPVRPIRDILCTGIPHLTAIFQVIRFTSCRHIVVVLTLFTGWHTFII